jgi:arylsulfatase A-like enzyme
VNYTFARAGDHSVTNRALELLNDGVEVLFIHYPNPDYFGHLSGWMGSIYMREMSNTDFEVGRLLNHLEENDWLQETLIILTADHGGSGTSHGSSRPADMLIPWIIAGPGVIQGAVLQEQVYVMDTAQTVLWVLELPLPSSEYGKPVFEAFGLETTGS